MGMRQNIKMVYRDSLVDDTDKSATNEADVIYIYSHWDGEDGESLMKSNLRHALVKGRERWGDESYLARIIFQGIIGKDEGITGYGLSPYEIGSNYPTIVVDLAGKTVDGVPFERFVNEL